MTGVYFSRELIVLFTVQLYKLEIIKRCWFLEAGRLLDIIGEKSPTI